MICWTGLAPWEFEFPFPGSLIYAFLDIYLPMQSNTAVSGPEYYGLAYPQVRLCTPFQIDGVLWFKDCNKNRCMGVKIIRIIVTWG